MKYLEIYLRKKYRTCIGKTACDVGDPGLGRYLGWDDPLEKGVAIHSSILAWNISWSEKPGGLVYRITDSWTRLSNRA